MRDTKWYKEDLFGLKTVDEVCARNCFVLSISHSRVIIKKSVPIVLLLWVVVVVGCLFVVTALALAFGSTSSKVPPQSQEAPAGTVTATREAIGTSVVSRLPISFCFPSRLKLELKLSR